MALSDYLLRGVRPEEFAALKEAEPSLIAIVREGFNEGWKPLVAQISVTTKYNPERNIIGIFIQQEEGEHLAVNSHALKPEEDTLVLRLYTALEHRLDMMRLRNEPWVESVADKDKTA